MKNKVTRTFITLLAVMLCMAAFSFTALAADATPPPTQTDRSVTTPTSSSNPLTPDGTGTVINDTTNGDGKEFLTITTTSKHVFYLISTDRRAPKTYIFWML